MIRRTLKDGRTVNVHRCDGLRKRCHCPRRAWASCPHPWHFSFKVKGGTHYRFPLEAHTDQPIVTRDDALKERDRLRILIRSGQFPPAQTPPPTTPEALTFDVFADRWLTHARAQQSASQRANDRAKVHRLSTLELDGDPLGQRPIGLFTTDEWERVFTALQALAASTTNKYRQMMLSMQDWGLEKGYLSRLWLIGKVLQKGGTIARRKGARRDRRLVPDIVDDLGQITHPGEERRLMAAAAPWLQRLIIAALETGCRRGELLSLQWGDVSLARGQMTIRAEHAKTRTMRQVPLSPPLLAVLRLLAPDSTDTPSPSAFVFGTPTGGRIRDPKKAWARACRDAKVHDLQFRDLRHEAGSRILEAGWPLSHVQQMLGHENIATTSIYLNVTAEGLQDSMRRFGTGRQLLHTVAHQRQLAPPPRAQDDAPAPQKSLVN